MQEHYTTKSASNPLILKGQRHFLLCETGAAAFSQPQLCRWRPVHGFDNLEHSLCRSHARLYNHNKAIDQDVPVNLFEGVFGK